MMRLVMRLVTRLVTRLATVVDGARTDGRFHCRRRTAWANVVPMTATDAPLSGMTWQNKTFAASAPFSG